MVAELPREGDFGQANIPEVAFRLHQATMTGMLRAERDGIIKVIYFRDGEISFASSNEETDRLGHVFIRAGKMTEAQLLAAMSKVDARTSLGKTFIALGYITPKELLWGARKQVEDIMLSLYYWRDGRYQFIEGPLPKKIANLRLSTPQVLARTVMQVTDRDWVLERLGSLDTVFSTKVGAFDQIRSLELGDEVEVIVAKVDGTRSVRDICTLSRMDDFTVSKVLYALYLLDLLEIERGEAVEEPEPSLEAEGEPDPMGLSSLSDDMNFSDLFSDEEPRPAPAQVASRMAALATADTVTFHLSDAEPDAGTETMAISPTEADALRATSAAMKAEAETLAPLSPSGDEETIIVEAQAITPPQVAPRAFEEPSVPEAVAEEPRVEPSGEGEAVGESSFRDLFRNEDEAPAAEGELRFESEPEPRELGEAVEEAPAAPSFAPPAVASDEEDEDEELRLDEDEAVEGETDELHAPASRSLDDAEATFVPSAALPSPLPASEDSDQAYASIFGGEPQSSREEPRSVKGAAVPSEIPALPPVRIPARIDEADFAELFRDDPHTSTPTAPPPSPPKVAIPAPPRELAPRPPEKAVPPVAMKPAPARPPMPPSRSPRWPIFLGIVAIAAVVGIFAYVNWETFTGGERGMTPRPPRPTAGKEASKPPGTEPAGEVETLPALEGTPTTTTEPTEAPATPKTPPPAATSEAKEATPAIKEATPKATLPTPKETPSPAAAAPTARPTPTPEAGTPAGADARESGYQLALSGKFAEAASAYGALVKDKRGDRYAIQLELDCQVASLADAWRNGGKDRSVIFLPKALKGRACYVVLWGLYPSEAAASAQIPSVPRTLVEAGAKPRVVRIDAIP